MFYLYISLAVLLILILVSVWYVYKINKDTVSRHRAEGRRKWFEEPDQSSYFNCLMNPPTEVEEPDLPPGSYITYDGDREVLHEIIEDKHERETPVN